MSREDQMNTPMVRLNPHNPGAGRFKKTHVDPWGRRYFHGKWYPATLEQSRYCASVRQRNNDMHSQLAFVVARNMEEALQIEDAEAAERKRITRQVVGQEALTVDDMRELRKRRNERANARSDQDGIFTTPAAAADGWNDAVCTAWDTQVERAKRKGISMPDVDGQPQSKKRKRRGSRGGRGRGKSSQDIEEMRALVAAADSRAKAKDLSAADLDDEGEEDERPDEGVVLGRKEPQVDEGHMQKTDRASDKATAAEFDKNRDGDGG